MRWLEKCLQGSWVGRRGQKDAEAGGEEGLRSALGFSWGKEGREPWRTEREALVPPAAVSEWAVTEAGTSGLRADQAGALMVSEAHAGVDN